MKKTDWIKVTDQLPETFDVLGSDVSTNVLVCTNHAELSVASTWDGVWIDSRTGFKVTPTHWLYVEFPE